MKLHHAALVSSSRKNADRFYEEILGLTKIKTFGLSEELGEQIFGSPTECQIILYGNQDLSLEVFLADPTLMRANAFEHLCLEVAKREEFLAKCQSKGLNVKRIPKGDAFLTFVEDYDGNLFEIKELANFTPPS